MEVTERIRDSLHRFFDGDFWYSFTQSKITMISGGVTAVMLLAAFFAPLISLQNPFDPAALNLMDAFTPPVWAENGSWAFPLGTDNQGRDLYSAILYGSRLSLFIGFASVSLAMILGVTLDSWPGTWGVLWMS